MTWYIYLYKYILLIIIAAAVLPIFHKVHAEIKVYKITDSQTLYSHKRTQVNWYTHIHIPWRSGKVIIATSPDGTGAAKVGPQFGVYGMSDLSKRFVYDAGCEQKPMPPLDITHLMGAKYGVGDTSLLIRYHRNNCPGDYVTVDGEKKHAYNISQLYIIHYDDYEVNEMPFLELPWDYASAGLRFEEAALRINSYFDHEYPLLSSGLSEPDNAKLSLVYYKSAKHNADLDYSSHDGYDWGRSAKAVLGEPVRAAASGMASYHYNKYSGNAIYIDHGNGYQTRYYHLSPQGLITSSSKKVQVEQKQQIGRVGFTGNVRPSGEGGAHIHFMVIKDKDHNGSFDDNIPDGIVDPFGWQGKGTDPWPAYSFTYNGKHRTGTKSTYLWKKSLKNTKQTLTAQGGTFYNSGSNTTFKFPMQVVSHDVILDTISKPPIEEVSIEGIIQKTLSSLGNRVGATITDGFGKLITTFGKAFNITFSFDGTDAQRYKKDTIAIYSSSDGQTWKKEDTVLDISSGRASTQVNHLTEFALIGEKLDAIAPVTTVSLTGDIYTDEIYTSSVTTDLQVTDEPKDDSLGVRYSAYKINDQDWETYTGSFTLKDEGDYSIQYYSEDNDGNVEDTKTLAFSIDFDPPKNTPTPNPTSASTTTSTSTPTPSQSPVIQEQQAATSTPTAVPTATPTVASTATPSPTPVSNGAPIPTNTPTPRGVPTVTSMPTPTRSLLSSNDVKHTSISKSPTVQPAQAGQVASAHTKRRSFKTLYGAIMLLFVVGGVVVWRTYISLH